MTTTAPAQDRQMDDYGIDVTTDHAVDPLQSQLRAVEPVAVILDFLGATLDDYDRLLQGMDLAPGGIALPGCLFHWVRPTPDGVRVCEVWRNRALFEIFHREEALRAFRRLGLSEPELSFYPVHNYLTSADLTD